MPDVRFLNLRAKKVKCQIPSLFSALHGAQNEMDPIFFKMVSKCYSCENIHKHVCYIDYVLFLGIRSKINNNYFILIIRPWASIGFDLWCLVTIVTHQFCQIC